ncbi:DUF1624 domain-containing protein [Terricaulis sp.]|uniref:DUF1624 domain-containing protein n=1 Tax=Terricaulis sp. TaxID=2768686 RepID=UPI003783C65E
MTATAHPAQNPAAARAVEIAGVRLREIDILRGLVIVLMALDHVRDYMHVDAFDFSALDPDRTNVALYLTRWVTHLCAPTFVFLAGVSSYLQIARGKTKRQLSTLLATRGLWLIVLELTVLSFGWSFSFPYPPFLQVIWAIGWSMIVLAGVIWLPRLAVLAVGVAIIVGHNAFDGITDAGILWFLLHQSGPLLIGDQPIGLASYPIIPWIGVICFGYGLGAVFLAPADKRDRNLFILGLCMLAAFLVLRGINGYGDPRPWSLQDDMTKTMMSFFDVTKYGPSLMYVLVTLGIVLTIWPLLARLPKAAGGVLATYGAVPFFFYVLHVYLVHSVAVLGQVATGRSAEGQFGYLFNTFARPDLMADMGFPLWAVYLFWIAIVAALYLPCRYWARLKRTRRDWWLSYL